MKTLVIKLAGTVDDSSLMRLGELRMSITPVSGRSTQKFTISSNEPISLEINGNGTFTETGTKRLDVEAVTNKVIEYSNGTFTLSLLNKEALTSLNLFTSYDEYMNIGLDLSQLRTMINLTYLDLRAGGITGDVSTLSGLTNIQYIMIGGSRVRGDISFISNYAKLRRILIQTTYINGNLPDMQRFTELTGVEFYDAYFSGNLSQLSSNTDIFQLISNNALEGDISALAGLTNLQDLRLTNKTAVTGNTSSLAHLHPNNGGKLSFFQRGGTSIVGDWPPS